MTGPTTPISTSGTVHRLRVAAICMLLTGLSFRQEPGFITPDTKIDLIVDPLGFLGRALQLWDPSGNFGQLQNQAYGYAFPMGPFFALGDVIGVPAWAMQRAWWAVLLCVAFLGVVKLAGRLNIGNPTSRLFAGVTFALSVRIMTELGGISVEAWPTAVAPWVLVPLVALKRGARLRRPVTLSALAVAAAGGVNATAVLAVVPLAVLWLFSLDGMRRRLTAIGAWGVAVTAATAWWLLPLFLLGRYAPPFLDFIETASVTTQVTDAQSMLRGASHWQAYFKDIYGAVWPAGRRLATEPLLLAATAVVAALGLAGLARRGMPHRRFLITGLILGLAMVGFGHVSLPDSGFAQWQRDLLDGPAVALRNVHKFDVVIRLPLVLGLAHLLGVFAMAARRQAGPARVTLAQLRSVGVSSIAALALLGVATPALAGGLVARGHFVNVPAHWQQAASWLDDNLGDHRVLIIPGSRFGDYRWGSTGDEVIQALTDKQWAVRNAIPLTPPGTIRMLDGVESVLATGAGSAGLADVLARAGVRYLLVRADGDYGKSGGVAPLIVRQALERSPGIVPVRAFGPDIGGALAPGRFLDRSLGGPVPSLEIFRVDRVVKQVVAYDASAASALVGGPESLLPLAASGALPAGPTVLAGDLATGIGTGSVLLTDGLRRREVNFGHSRDNQSATLTERQRTKRDGPASDYLPAWADGNLTTARYGGIDSVTASSSWSDPQSFIGSRPEHHPYAALDGQPDTSWRTPPGVSAVGQWLEIRFPEPKIVSQLTLQFDLGAETLPTTVTVNAGGEKFTTDGFGNSMTIYMYGHFATSRIRIMIDKVVPRPAGAGAVGIAEVQIPDLTTERTLVVPSGPESVRPAEMLFSAAPAAPTCYFTPAGPQCDPERARGSEDGDVIARTARLPVAGSYEPAIWARPKPSLALDKVLSPSKLHTVSASSSATDEPTASAWSTIDGDPTTSWYPGAADEHPWLRLQWPEQRQITGLRLSLAATVAAGRPWAVQVVGDGGMRVGVVDENGVVGFDKPMRTDEVTVFFLGSMQAYSRDPYLNKVSELPVAVSEIGALPDAPRPVPNPDQVIELPCGSGPTLTIGGQKWPTRLTATRRELRELREVPATFCTASDRDGDRKRRRDRDRADDDAGKPPAVSLSAGEQTVVASAGELSVPVRLRLRPVTESGTDAAGDGESLVQVDHWGRADRRLTLPPRDQDRIIAVRENANPGWQATTDGKKLQPLVVDGWQQGWLVPAGISGEVLLTFAPEQTFRGALLLGAILLALVVAVAVLPGNGGPAHVPDRARPRSAWRGRLLPLLAGGVGLIVFAGPMGVLLAVLGVVGVGFATWLTGRLPAADQLRVHRSQRWLWLLPAAILLFGHWLANGLADPHGDPAPQLAGIAAVVAIWLSACWPVRSPSRKAPSPGHERAFEAVPAGRGQ